jgi:uncharacterized membrane-anchored protein
MFFSFECYVSKEKKKYKVSKKSFKWLFLILVCIIQLYVILAVIVSHEKTLKLGKQYKFKCAPIDPYDPFRGRYVSLNIEDGTVEVLTKKKFQKGEKVYAVLQGSKDGYTSISEIVRTKPKHENYFITKIKYKVWSVQPDLEKKHEKILIELPFDRYYMEEDMAPKAERLYLRHVKSEKKGAYITVRIRNGKVVLEDLFIDGKTVVDFCREKLPNN